MKKLLILTCLLTSPVYATLVSHTDYTSGATITASGQNANENAIINAINGNIDSSNLAANAVTTNAIANNSVTYAKFDTPTQSSMTNTLLSIGAAQFPQTDMTFSGAVAFTSVKGLEIGTTIYLNNVGGTTGQLMQANTLSIPTWVNSSSVGGLVLIASTTASSSSSIAFSGIGALYSGLEIIIDNLHSGTDAVSFHMTFSGVSGSNCSYENLAWAGTTPTVTSATSQTDLDIMDGAGTGAGVIQSLDVKLLSPGLLATRKRATWTSTGFYQSGLFFTTSGGGICTADANAISSITFAMSSGNIATGTFYLYGYKTN